MKSTMNEKNRMLQQQFAQMYDSFGDEIFKFCLSKTRNRDESLDITQETFIKTWDYIRNGKTIDLARPFLYRTAKNLIIDHFRKKKAVSLDAMFSERTSFDVADPEPLQYGKALEKEELLQRLKQLPEHHYEILVLRFIQELTLSEIAEMYQESENAVSVKIHRAIKQAQKLFPEDFEA